MFIFYYFICRFLTSMFSVRIPSSLGMPRQASVQDGAGDPGPLGKKAETKGICLLSLSSRLMSIFTLP